MNHLRFLLIPLLLLFAACASYSDLPSGTVLEVTGSPVIETEVVEVEPLPSVDPPSLVYQVGPGDVLYVNVNGRPELGSPVVTGAGKVVGSRVDGAGYIHLPLIGGVEVSGLTIGEIQARLQQLYRPYLNTPWVVVEVAEFRSQPVYLLGQFKNPGAFYLDRPMTLLQGLALGSGLTDAANLRSARLLRSGRTVPVDIREIIEEGNDRQNVWLQAGDTIFVPDDRNQNVFVFGAVARPGPVPMPNGRLTLPQALAAAGLGEVRGNIEYVRIIRSISATRGELIVVDANLTMRGETLPYSLAEGDIVYVPRSAVGNWNQAIAEILPSLQAVSAILQPFVQIKFLTDD
jgi:polysaccharide biosynthesis/export protein